MAPCVSLFFLFLFTFASVPANSLPTFFPGAAYQSLTKQAKTRTSKPKLPFMTHYFPQTLDHFNFQPKSSKLFYQKYLINSDYWQKGAPLFVYTGNEGDIEWFAANTGFLLDIAPKFKALLVFIEHRFYGESMPFGKHSYQSAKTLGYLTSQQAMADFAVLIRSLKQNLSSVASPVVVFGGSYGGMLAAWFRLKYPHIAVGALASSAPILQFDKIVPWSSFYDAVSRDFKDVSLTCYEVIKGSWAELEAMSTQKEALAELSKAFRTCKSLRSTASARDWLWTAFVYTAMVNYPTEANFMKPLPAYPVQRVRCARSLINFHRGQRTLVVLSRLRAYINFSHSENCFDIEHEVDSHGLHGWDWQTCTEMVMPMTCSKESMFPPSGFNYEEFAAICQMKYGVSPRPHWITTEFGGERIQKVLKRFGSNIIFSNGMQDPWSRGGVLKNVSSSIIALVTENGAHHVDFRSSTKDDPDWLVELRKQEVGIIQKWLNEYYADLRHE